jgi:hypothetical protein
MPYAWLVSLKQVDLLAEKRYQPLALILLLIWCTNAMSTCHAMACDEGEMELLTWALPSVWANEYAGHMAPIKNIPTIRLGKSASPPINWTPNGSIIVFITYGHIR